MAPKKISGKRTHEGSSCSMSETIGTTTVSGEACPAASLGNDKGTMECATTESVANDVALVVDQNMASTKVKSVTSSTEHDGPTPEEQDVPTPAEHDGPTPAAHDVPTPAEHDVPTPAEHDVPTLAAQGVGVENETEIVATEKPTKVQRKTKVKKVSTDPPKAPKPANAYMVFYKQELKKDEYTGILLPERAKMIGALWRQMDDASRAPFNKIVAEAKQVAMVA